MPRRPSHIRFSDGTPGRGILLSEDDYALIVSAIGPCHGPDIEDFLAAVPAVPGGRRLDANNPIVDDVLAAVGVEVHGYMKLDEERDGRSRIKPKRGSTAERLLTIYEQIERGLA